MKIESIKVEKFPKISYQGRILCWDTRQHRETNLKYVEVKADERWLGEKAAAYFSYPSNKLCVLAVTGTNGKTTSASLMRAILVDQGFATAEIGTLGLRLFQNGKTRELETGFTTPSAPTLQHLFYQFVECGITHVVMEASSHAIELGRLSEVNFDGALFTNLSQDHLDFHKTMEAYKAAKAKLFQELLPQQNLELNKNKFAVINLGSPIGHEILEKLPETIKSLSFFIGKTHKIIQNNLEGLSIVDNEDKATLSSPLVGAFNAENIVGAMLMCLQVPGVSKAQALATLKVFPGVSGRLEKILTKKTQEDKKHVFVDYAHSPDALEKVLSTLSVLMPLQKKLFVVFGCGGDRDKTKRPLMGEVAARLADKVYVTSDNPRSEAPLDIIKNIMEGVPQNSHAEVVTEVDRKKALQMALSEMESGDVCLVAGKGHENYQIVGAAKAFFSDVAICHDFFT